MNILPGIFSSASKNLTQNERHFKTVELYVFTYKNESEATLQDNTFGDITFDQFHGYGIKKIGTNVFNKTANLTSFYCWKCPLEYQPPNYDLQNMFNQLTQLTSLTLGLNVSKIPSNAITSNQSQINYLLIEAKHQILTINSHAFLGLNQLTTITFYDTKFNSIQTETFKLGKKSNEQLKINFIKCSLTGQTFQNNSFDGVQQPLEVVFQGTNINYIPESVFKPVLNEKNNLIDFFDVDYGTEFNSKIDCSDCRNHWLIKEKKDGQVLNAFCQENHKNTLFDQEIQTKLSQKCNKLHI